MQMGAVCVSTEKMSHFLQGTDAYVETKKKTPQKLNVPLVLRLRRYRVIAPQQALPFMYSFKPNSIHKIEQETTTPEHVCPVI